MSSWPNGDVNKAPAKKQRKTAYVRNSSAVVAWNGHEHGPATFVLVIRGGARRRRPPTTCICICNQPTIEEIAAWGLHGGCINKASEEPDATIGWDSKIQYNAQTNSNRLPI